MFCAIFDVYNHYKNHGAEIAVKLGARYGCCKYLLYLNSKKKMLDEFFEAIFLEYDALKFQCWRRIYYRLHFQFIIFKKDVAKPD